MKLAEFVTRLNGRRNGNGNARPTSGAGLLEWHSSAIEDINFPSGSLVVTDNSAVLNELGGLRAYVGNHEGLQRLVGYARWKGCGFIHYGFSTPTIDRQAIKTIGAKK